MAKATSTELIRGSASHRRTENDYMGVLLAEVTLEDWREVVSQALQAAKNGDQQARSWLAQYLVGRPEGKAPTPLNVVVQQLSGADPLVDRLAAPHLSQATLLDDLMGDKKFDGDVLVRIASELNQKVRPG